MAVGPSKRIAMLEDEAHLVPRLHNLVLNALVYTAEDEPALRLFSF